MPNPGAAEDFLSVINPESLVIKQGYGEPSLKAAVAGKAFQFEREGYFCLDSRYATADKLVFNRTVGLRDTGESGRVSTAPTGECCKIPCQRRVLRRFSLHF